MANSCDKLWRSILDVFVRFLEDREEFLGRTRSATDLVPCILYIRDRWKGL